MIFVKFVVFCLFYPMSLSLRIAPLGILCCTKNQSLAGCCQPARLFLVVS